MDKSLMVAVEYGEAEVQAAEIIAVKDVTAMFVSGAQSVLLAALAPRQGRGLAPRTARKLQPALHTANP
jgi:hypothetical protein